MALNDTIYAYAVGRTRSLETRLLERGRLERMIDASSAEDVLKILAETDYAVAASELEDVFDFEKMLSAELNRAFAIIKNISPRPELIAAFLMRFDVHNLKVLFKEGYLGTDSGLLVGSGNLNLEGLKYAVRENDFRDLPGKLRAACEGLVEEFSLSRDPQVIDFALDKVLYEELLGMAKKSRSSFLQGLFSRQVDLINLKVLIRVKRMKLHQAVLKNVLIKGGSLQADFLTGLIDEPFETLISAFAMSDYAELVAEGVRCLTEGGSLTHLEKLADDYITAYLKNNKWNAFGLEPLVGYLWGKETEIKNIRLVMVGKINNLPAAAIRERLRDVYI